MCISPVSFRSDRCKKFGFGPDVDRLSGISNSGTEQSEDQPLYSGTKTTGLTRGFIGGRVAFRVLSKRVS